MAYAISTKIGLASDFQPQILGTANFSVFGAGINYNIFINDYNSNVNPIRSLSDIYTLYALSFYELEGLYKYTTDYEMQSYLANLMSGVPSMGNLIQQHYATISPTAFYRNLNQERYSFIMYPSPGGKIAYAPIYVWFGTSMNTDYSQEASAIVSILSDEFGPSDLKKKAQLFLGDLSKLLLLDQKFSDGSDNENLRVSSNLNFSNFEDKIKLHVSSESGGQ
jgi:hypothetical protein